MKAKLAIKVMVFLMGVIFYHGAIDAHVEQPKDLSGIGIDEKLGQFIPLDLTFYDENGNAILLKQLPMREVLTCPHG
jgi:hypothetical protein